MNRPRPPRESWLSSPTRLSRCKTSGSISKINGPFLFELKSPAEYKAGFERAIAMGWLYLQESGTYVRFTTPERPCSPERRKEDVLARHEVANYSLSEKASVPTSRLYTSA